MPSSVTAISAGSAPPSPTEPAIPNRPPPEALADTSSTARLFASVMLALIPSSPARRLGALSVALDVWTVPLSEASAADPLSTRSNRACPCRLRGAIKGPARPSGALPTILILSNPSLPTSPDICAWVPAGPRASVLSCQPCGVIAAEPVALSGPLRLGTTAARSGMARVKSTCAFGPVTSPATEARVL
jgi:hypothetical protein